MVGSGGGRKFGVKVMKQSKPMSCHHLNLFQSMNMNGRNPNGMKSGLSFALFGRNYQVKEGMISS